MEKIWIQFSESDYQIYQNYCLWYYTVFDTLRKRSIHLFLDLFEKDILPVEEHDLSEVYQFFSKKCDELQTDHHFLGKNNSSVDEPQFQVCRDMLFLVEDFEKIYRLIEKYGVTSNYFQVLATFSKIIEEEKKVCISAINEYDRTKIESFAPSIAKIIRTRLGSDAGWEKVLFELAGIVRKFNRTLPDQKISQNAIFLLGAAVTAQFNPDIRQEEIQQTLERYLQESELAEFESILNKIPYTPGNDPDLDTSGSCIFEALRSISCKEIDPVYYETVVDPILLKNPDNSSDSSLSLVPGMSEAITPFPRTFLSSSRRVQANKPSRFDVDVCTSSKSLVIVPEKMDRISSGAYAKSAVPQYSIMFMGIVIFILFTVTMAATSGIWNPVQPLNNSSMGILDNISHPVNTLSNTPSKVAGMSTTVIYQKSPPQPVKNESVSPVEEKKVVVVVTPEVKTTMSSSDLNRNFMRIAFGPDNTKISKLPDERISLAMTGEYTDDDLAMIDQFNNNSLINQFTSGVKFGEQATIVMTFLPDSSLKNIEGLDDAVISKNPQTGYINYMRKTVKVQFISKDMVYINSDYKGDQ